VENSVFPRGPKKGGDKKKKGGPISGTSSCLNNQLSPPQIVTEMRDEDAFLDSDDEGAAILGRSTDFNTNSTALTSRSGISDVSKLTQDTSIHDGVHVTSL